MSYASTKVTVSKEVAEAIKEFIRNNIEVMWRSEEEAKAILTAEHCGQDWRQYEDGQFTALNEISTYELMRALVIGYEVERTPEEKMREYYERTRLATTGFTETLFEGKRQGVSATEASHFTEIIKEHARTDIPKLLAEIDRLRTGIIHVIKETSCDDTWDYLNRLLDGKESTDLPYRIGGDSE